MKKKTFLRFLLIPVLLHGMAVLLPAQETNRNMLQLKYTIDYFKGYEPSLFAGLLFPDISYQRYFKNKQRFLELKFDNLFISYRPNKLTPSDIGSIFLIHHHILETKIGSYLTVTPRLRFLAKAGLAFRLGEEIKNAYLFFNPLTNVQTGRITKTYRYCDIGAGASFEFLYRYGKKERWYLTLEAGGRRFFHRKITNRQQLNASLGIGYAF